MPMLGSDHKPGCMRCHQADESDYTEVGDTEGGGKRSEQQETQTGSFYRESACSSGKLV